MSFSTYHAAWNSFASNDPTFVGTVVMSKFDPGIKSSIIIFTYGPTAGALLEGGATGVGEGGAAAGGGGAGTGWEETSGGISTSFQSCPSSTIKAMRVPKRTFLLPSSI